MVNRLKSRGQISKKKKRRGKPKCFKYKKSISNRCFCQLINVLPLQIQNIFKGGLKLICLKPDKLWGILNSNGKEYVFLKFCRFYGISLHQWDRIHDHFRNL